MKRVYGVMAVAALLAGVSTAHAQQREVLYNKFDLGLYGGGAWTSDWFELGGADFGSGWSPVFGATGTYWFNQRLGARLNGSYMPMRAPTTDATFIISRNDLFEITTPADLRDRSGWPVNTWMADLSLSYKPWMHSSTDFLASTYLWLGGGALWSNFSSREVLLFDIDPDFDQIILENLEGCVPEYLAVGMCYDSSNRTEPQLTFGLGFDLISLGSKVGLYGELGGNVYKAPIRNDFEDVIIVDPTEPIEIIDVFPSNFDRKTAFTGRATAGVKFAFGEVLAPVVPIPPPPPPPAPAERTIQVCVVDNGQLQMISAIYRPSSGDTLVNGQQFAQAHPTTVPNYAAGANWYLQSSEITFMDNTHVKYGVTRMITPSQLQRVGDFQGTPIFAESGTSSPWEVVYVPVRPGCEFQPYQLREVIRPRG